MKKVIVLAVLAMAMVSCAAVTVTGVRAQQRWPWNNLVDVDYVIEGAAEGEVFAIGVEAQWAGGAKKVVAKSFMTEPVASGGGGRIVWDFGADCPDTIAADCRISVTATPIAEAEAIYMVIDLSGGADSSSYPVRYTRLAPVHTKGAANEPCQTTELWLRRVCASGKTYRLGTYSEQNVNYARQTNDFYIAIFETTQQQWYQLTGKWPSKFANADHRASRPFDYFAVNDLLGEWEWPDNKAPTENSVLKKLRDRTGLSTLNLPTDGQWQYAVSGGPEPKDEDRYGDVNEICRYSGNNGGYVKGDEATCDATKGTAYAGSYEPNSLGLYDMLGNVAELVLDPYMTVANLKKYYVSLGVGTSPDNPVLEPIGVSQSIAANQEGLVRTHALIMKRGGDYGYSEANTNYRTRSYEGYSSHIIGCGFRFAVTCEK